MNRRIVAVLVLVALVFVGRVVNALRGDDPAAAPRVVVTTPAAAASPSPTATSSSPSPSAPPQAQSVGVVAAAETWTRAWLNTKGGQAAWLARLRPITDGELYDGLALPGVAAAVPLGTVRPGAQVLAALDGVTSVRVPTTAGPMVVDLTSRGGRWVVVSNDRARG